MKNFNPDERINFKGSIMTIGEFSNEYANGHAEDTKTALDVLIRKGSVKLVDDESDKKDVKRTVPENLIDKEHRGIINSASLMSKQARKATLGESINFKSSPSHSPHHVPLLERKAEEPSALSNLTTYIAGVTKDNRQEYIRKYLHLGDQLKLVREPYNSFDKNAIAVYCDSNTKIGYIPKDIALNFAKEVDKGIKYYCEVHGLNMFVQNGYKYFGVNINISKDDSEKDFKDDSWDECWTEADFNEYYGYEDDDDEGDWD